MKQQIVDFLKTQAARLLKKLAYSDEKISLAFEYGVVFSETAKKMNVEITPELMIKAEIMMEGEFAKQTPTHLAVNMTPNIMAVFELDLSK